MGKSKGRGRGRGRGRGNPTNQPQQQQQQSQSGQAEATHSGSNVQPILACSPEEKGQAAAAVTDQFSNITIEGGENKQQHGQQQQQQQAQQPKQEQQEDKQPQQHHQQQAQKPKQQKQQKQPLQQQQHEQPQHSKQQQQKQKQPQQQQPQQQQPQPQKAKQQGSQKKQQKPVEKLHVELEQLTVSTKNTRLTDYKLPSRPGLGRQGRRTRLESNFFEIKIPSITISQYDVTFFDGKNDDKAPKDLTRRVFQDFVDKNRKVFKSLPVYDGRKIMYAKDSLEFQGKKSFDVSFMEDSRERKFKITLQHAGFVELSTLNDAVQGKGEVSQDSINALDLVLRQAPSLKFVSIGSKFFKSDGAVNIGGGKEMWHGYHQSVRPSRWKLFLNMDVSATAFVRNISVIEYMEEILNTNPSRPIDLSRPLKDSDRRSFSKEIEGLKVYITYMGKQKRKYRVNGLTKQAANKQTFPCEKDGKTSHVTVERYFAQEKNIKLQHPHLPCLHVGDIKRNVYLPMEVCRMVEGQQTRKLTDIQTANMIKQTSKRPDVRHSVIGKNVDKANYNKDRWVREFGIKVAERPEEVDARVLPPPAILYAQDKQGMVPRFGAWNMKGKRLYKGANIKAWAIIDYEFGRPLQQQALERFIHEISRTAQSMGMTMGRPSFVERFRSNIGAATVVERALKADRNIELLMVILHGTTPFYGQLKTICDTHKGAEDIADRELRQLVQKRGLSTQCVQDKNVFKCNPMTLAQLCLKINAKMGGVNNAIDGQNKITRPKRVFDEPVIFLGADVTHPGRGDKTRPSIAAVVGSIDAYPIRYAVSVRAQTHRMEVIEDLKNIAKELLKQFYFAVGKKPAKIVMFRDGVSEGQFQQVLHHEMRAIQQACCELENGYQPGITFVIVQKRHHARFRALDDRDKDKSGNCLAGTTIDDGVCHPTQFDYYQYSHAGIQGTSRPTHYHVLWDDNKFTADEMQALSFMLSHLYVRCTRSVSIPAPAYYAHHVAYRARYHLQKEEGSESSESGVQPEDLYSGKLTLARLIEIVKPSAAMINRMYFV